MGLKRESVVAGLGSGLGAWGLGSGAGAGILRLEPAVLSFAAAN